MVNRRILRVKAVKNIYTYESCQQANYDLALDGVLRDFSHDLNSMEPYDKEHMQALQKQAVGYFKSHFGKAEQPESTDQAARVSVEKAMETYKEENDRDFKKIKKELLKDFDKIRHQQMLILQLLRELAKQNKKIVEEKLDLSKKFGQQMSAAMPLHHNSVLKDIFEEPAIKNEMTRAGVSWHDEEDKLRDWYKTIVRKQEFLKDYLQQESPGREDDYNALDEIIRKLIFKHEVIEQYFDERDINWDENKQIVRSLVLKTIKSAKEEGAEITLPPLSYNWDEDTEYYVDLFVKTVRNNEYYDGLIEGKVKNWKLDRLALLDKVIIKTALCEMTNFPSIPVKVSINEFIEISKTYSTPKSKNFINGLLDAISEDLIQAGEIKKSGRGLIDTK